MQVKKNKVAVITGGGTGIGATTAEILASTGVNVVVVGRRPKPLAEVSAKITSKGGVAVAYQADVTDFSAMEELVNKTVERFVHVDKTARSMSSLYNLKNNFCRYLLYMSK